MLQRIIKRTGINKETFDYVTVESGDSYQKYDGLITLGEVGLNTVLGEAGVDRWWSHIVPWNDKPCLVLPSPHRLLPFSSAEEEDLDDLDRKFRSPTRYLGLVNQRIHQLMASAQGTREWRAVPYEQRDYSWNDLGVFEQFVEEVIRDKPILSYDIETLYDKLITNEEDKEQYLDKDTIERMSFTIRPYQAISIPATGYFLDGAAKLLENPDIPKLGWNVRNFDNPVLYKQNNIEVRGVIYDGMDIAHVVKPDLDKNLESTSAWLTIEYPWKHLNKLNEELYSCIDSDVALRNFESAKAYLERNGLWEKTYKHFVYINKYLDIAHRNGVPVNTEKQKELSVEFRQLSIDKTLMMQDMVPDNLRKKRLYVKQTEPEWIPVSGVGTERYCSNCGQININKTHPCVKKDNAEVVTREKVQTFYYKPAPAVGSSYDEVKKWLKDNGFNPGSSEQVKTYAKIHHHPLSKNWKTDTESAGTKHLEKLSKLYGKEHPIYAEIVDFRKLDKALTAFVDGWVPDDRGHITTIYGNAPMSFRFSSRNVNLQQVSARESNPYAIRSRELICAPPGYVILGADSTAIEAVMSGWYMGDPDYVLAAKQDIHSYVTCKHLGIPFNEAGIKKAKEATNDKGTKLRDVFKRINHLLNYGGTPYMMHMTDPDVFPSVKDAKMMMNFIFQSVPNLPKWHESLREEARDKEYLTNAWGYRYDFHDVYTYSTDEYGQLILDKYNKPVIKKGKDFNRVIAIKPQSSAALFMRENVGIVGDNVDPSWIPANFTIHDAIYLIVPDNSKDIEYGKAVIREALTRPIPEMDNLTVGCEFSLGKDWYNMSKIEVIPML